MRRLTFFLVLSFVACFALGRLFLSGEPKSSLIEDSKSIVEPVFELGVISPEVKIGQEIEIRNPFSDYMVVEEVISSCGCVIPKPGSERIDPSGLLKWPIDVIPGRRKVISSNVIIKYKIGNFSNLAKIHVRGDVDWKVQLVPKRVVFWDQIETSDTAFLYLKAKDGGEVKIEEIECDLSYLSFATFDGSPAVIEIMLDKGLIDESSYEGGFWVRATHSSGEVRRYVQLGIVD